MSSIDERVVSMKFDNGQFQKGVADTNNSLENLKKGLNLDAAAKSLDGLNAAGGRFSLAGIGSGIEAIASKFSTLSIMGITALTNITNKAIDAGIQMANSLTLAPIKAGFDEYEVKMGSIQTILANTARYGTTLDDVTKSLDNLNAYADKTIYSFGDMTRNIGLFTNAGIRIEDATSMIKGFSNEAAASGTNAEQAAGAAYQLSQALSKGKVTLEDWRSLTNAGMGNKNMQNGLIEIADAMGTFSGKSTNAKEAAKDFNGSLQEGWMTADVMQNYLKIQAGELSDEQMHNLKLSDDQIAAFHAQQKTAEEAATKVRTWSALVGTLQESVGSSWGETWGLLIGNFNEATDLFTGVNNTLGPLISQAGNIRNQILTEWKNLGGRTVAIDGIKLAFDALMSVMKPIIAAFKEIFPPMTGAKLFELTKQFHVFTEGLKPSAQAIDEIHRLFKGLFAFLDIGWLIIQKIWGVLERLFKGMDGGGASLLTIAARFGDFLVKIHDILLNSEKLNDFFFKMGEILKTVVQWLTSLVKNVADFVKNFHGIKLDTSGITGAVDNLQKSIGKLKPTGEAVGHVWDGLGTVFQKALDIGKRMATELGKAFGGLGSTISSGLGHLDFNTILGILGTGLIGGLVLMVKKAIKTIKGGIEELGHGGDLLKPIKEAFGGLTDTLSNMQATLKASTLMLIAAAIALLTVSVVALSKIDPTKLAGALTALTVMFVQLSASMAILTKINMGASLAKLTVLGVVLVLLAISVRILAGAVKELSGLDWQGLLKGLVGVTGLLLGLASAAKIMSGQTGNLITTGAGLVLVAFAVKILVGAVKEFSGMPWEEMKKGLIGVGTLLAELAIFTRLADANKAGIGTGLGLILLGVALKIMGSAVRDFAAMDMDKMKQGLIALGTVLAELGIFTRLINPSGMVSAGVAMVILGAALKIIASALGDFGGMPWEVMGKGLLGMAGALAAITIAVNFMPPTMILSAIALVVIAAALKILVTVLKDMGGMSWEEIGKSMVVLAGSLLILALAMAAMTEGLLGAAAMLVMAVALAIFIPILQSLGKMSWEQIGTGLGALAAAFLLLGIAGVVLLPAIPGLVLLGVAILLLGTGALLAGVGMLAFAAGLTALSVAGAAGTVVLVGMVQALLGLIPFAMEQLGKGIVAFAKVIGDSVPTFIEAMVKLLMGLLEAINTLAPQIVQTLANLIILLLNTLVTYVPQFVDAGLKILIGFLDGIANNIGAVINSATNVIVNFLNGIADNMGRILDAGTNVIIKFIEGVGSNALRITNAAADTIVTFVNGLAQSIRDHTQEMKNAGLNLAGAIIDGMTGGLASKATEVWNSAVDIGNKAINAIQHAIDSHSPSKKTHALGQYTSQGFALGISSLGDRVKSAAAGVGTAALEALKSTFSNITEASSLSDMTMSPTIKPVLDLSAIQKGAELISGMLDPSALVVDTSYNTAAAIVAAQRAQTTSDPNLQDTTAAGQNITLNQYNSSPKALSTAELYRQSKNLLSVVKTETGVLTGNVVQVGS